jgi:phenylalanyl-tRNA synthetase beta chain
MKVSLNWLKEYVNIDIPTDELATLIGARLVEIEEVIDNTHKYDGIYIVRVVECEDIPDTHLHLTKIDDCGIMDSIDPALRDEKGYLTVVCGAPNCHAGMFAAWIAPGATVPATYHTDEPFIIGARNMRGHTSQGMLAALDELDLGEDHEGILELRNEATEYFQPGQKFTDAFPHLVDVIFDIENKSLTHRPDCFGIIGFAREVAGILGQPFETPDWLTPAGKIDPEQYSKIDPSVKLEISISDPTLCPRYEAVILGNSGIIQKFKPQFIGGPTKQDHYLLSAGMRPISHIVDATNYLMLLTGQPLHAFDYDKLVAVGGTDSPKIIVRAAKYGEKLKLLDGKTIEMTPNDIVITSNDIPVALAGAMGGANTEIDANTKRIILESATFSLYNLRKTQMKHGIFSEAITRFTKGQPAELTDYVARAYVKALWKGKAAISPIFDAYPDPIKPASIAVTTDQINSLLGTTYSTDQIKSTLENVNFTVDGDNFTAPYWRTDIHIPEDIIEEVGRLLGYDNIPIDLPRHPFAAARLDDLFGFKSSLRDQLSRLGATEVLTYGFVSKRLISGAGQDPANSYEIVNSISPALECIRQSLVPSLLEKIYINTKSAYDHFALFEMNQIYDKSLGLTEEGVPVQRNHLALVVTDRKSLDSAYYEAELFARQLLASLNIKFTPDCFDSDTPTSKPFEPKRSAIVKAIDGTTIGIIGELRVPVTKHFKVPTYTSALEFDLDALLSLVPVQITKAIRTTEPVSRDLTITVKSDSAYATATAHIAQAFGDAGYDVIISPLSIFRPDGGATDKNISFHLDIYGRDDHESSLDEINQIMEKIS